MAVVYGNLSSEKSEKSFKTLRKKFKRRMDNLQNFLLDKNVDDGRLTF